MRPDARVFVAPSGRTRSQVWKKAALSVSALCLAIVTAEFVTRAVRPQDLTSPFRVFDHNGLSLNRANHVALDQAGRDRIVSYRFNAHHLRGPAVDFSKRRIMFLGDSFTFGWLLDEKDTYVSLLQQKADSEFGAGTFQMLNGAAIGWGTSAYLAFLENYGEALKPEMVAVFLSTDDIGRSMTDDFYVFDEQGALSFTPHPERRNAAKEVLDSLPLYDALLDHSHLTRLVRASYVTFQNSDPADQQRRTASTVYAQPLGQALFRRMRRWCAVHGCTLIVTTTGLQWLSDPGDPTSLFFEKARDFFESEGIPFWDISDALHRTAGGDVAPFVIPDDGHFNERGSRLVAALTWPWIKDQMGLGRHR